MKEFRIKTVHDDDLEVLLDKLSILGKIENGQLKCGVCGKTITKENLQCIYPLHDEIRMCCNELQCLLRVQQLLEG